MLKTSEQVRSAFLDFFRERGHEVVPSGALVPANDPTLLFANAGMVPFKDVFTGREKRSYSRAASSQKCIRISGKHNDLENVGPSRSHHTFFEMLGNFSFGDYFKEDAIAFAWEFLTGELKLEPERLVFSYFKGEAGMQRDEEACQLWKKLTGFGDDRVIGLGKDENFWSMGDTGPCGPCSEIHYFIGNEPNINSFGQEQTEDGSGWVEIWNLVFMQFERDHTGVMSPLPAPSIDTGMGLERIACVTQGKRSNYDTDLLRGLAEKTARIANKPYGGSMKPDDVSMRVIADHARTTAFLLAEGVMPDRTGREYVLRRVMRRAIRHGHRLGIEQPFLHEIAMEVVSLMGSHYQELVERRDHIASVTEQEEKRFRQTIERGLSLLDESFAELDQASSKTLSGEDAFRLYDTFGFPLDLTQVICQERGYQVDEQGYESALDQARRRSEFKGVEQAVESVYHEAQSKLPRAANGSAGKVEFLGYERHRGQSPIVAIVTKDGLVESLDAGQAGEVVVAKTPFYAEAGGQVGDQGQITADGVRFEVEDTVKPIGDLVVHRGRVESGTLRVDQVASLQVDEVRRSATRRHHSATHLLHWALRKVVGSHAQQKGSLVGPDQLRFDFTHTSSVTPEQLGQIEQLVNTCVLRNEPVRTEILSIDDARERGAMMIFEEKYGDTVRLLHIAESMELCGGTHVKATGDIGLFKIVGEQGIAAGVRRILATTGAASLAYVQDLEAGLKRAAQAAKSNPDQLVEKVEKIVSNERKLQRQIDDLQRKLATGGGGDKLTTLIESARQIAGVKVLGTKSEVTDRAALRELAETLRDKLGDSVVLVASQSEGKAQLVVTVSKSLTGRFKAGELIRGVAKVVGGSGGGRPDMAQAGGTDVAKLDEAVESIYGAVETSAAS